MPKRFTPEQFAASAMGELRTQKSFGGDTQASHTYQDTVYSKLRPGEALHASRPDAVRLVFVGRAVRTAGQAGTGRAQH